MVTLGLQIFLVELGGDFVKTSPLTLTQWLITIALGWLSMPIGVLMRFIPPFHENPDTFFSADTFTELMLSESNICVKKERPRNSVSVKSLRKGISNSSVINVFHHKGSGDRGDKLSGNGLSVNTSYNALEDISKETVMSEMLDSNGIKNDRRLSFGLKKKSNSDTSSQSPHDSHKIYVDISSPSLVGESALL
jgi:hypothetical protein